MKRGAMDPDGAYKIKRNYDNLMKDLEPREILPKLISFDVMDLDDFERIDSIQRPTQKERVREFISVIMMRGEDAYPKFIKALQLTNYDSLVTNLEDTKRQNNSHSPQKNTTEDNNNSAMHGESTLERMSEVRPSSGGDANVDITDGPSSTNIQHEERTVSLKIHSKSKAILCYPKEDRIVKWFNIVGVNAEEHMIIRVFTIDKFNFIKVGYCYKFRKLQRKGDICHLVSTGSVGFTSSFEVQTFPHPMLLLPEEQPATGSKRTLAQAVASSGNSHIIAKIVQVSPVKYRQDGRLPVRDVTLIDSSREAVKMALFGENAKMAFTPGSVLEVTKVYKMSYKNKMQLSTSTSSTCQLLPSSTLDDVSTENVCTDIDVNDPDLGEFVIDSILSVMTYDCCPIVGCCKKKLVEGKCPKCGGRKAIRTFLIDTIVSQSKTHVETKITLFEKDVKTIFGDIVIKSDDSLTESLIKKLPVTVQGRLTTKDRFFIH